MIDRSDRILSNPASPVKFQSSGADYAVRFPEIDRPADVFPVAEGLARECLSLPIFPGITEEQLGIVVEAIRAYFATRG